MVVMGGAGVGIGWVFLGDVIVVIVRVSIGGP